ncbi:MAG: hypothetical protein ABIH82_05215 [Candidatus Woesearchaeota archaeon]
MVGVLKVIFSILLASASYHSNSISSDPIEKYKQMSEHARKLSDRVNVTHTKAYLSAVDKHLLDNDGNYDFDKLDKDLIQREFKKTMKDFYVSEAKKYFNVQDKGDLDDFQKDMLMTAYVGAADEYLNPMIEKYGRKLTPHQFEEIKQDVQRGFEQRLYSVSSSHLKHEHREEMIKHMGLVDKIKPDLINLDELKTLLRIHAKEGDITDSVLRQIVGAYKMKHKDK